MDLFTVHGSMAWVLSSRRVPGRRLDGLHHGQIGGAQRELAWPCYSSKIFSPKKIMSNEEVALSCMRGYAECWGCHLRWLLGQSTADLVLPTAWWKDLRRSRTARTATSSTSSSGSLYIISIWWTDITSQGEQQDRHQLLQQAWLHCLPDRSSVLQWRQWRRCVSVHLSGWEMLWNIKCTFFLPDTTCEKRWPWMWRRKVWSLFPPLWACCHGWWLLGWPCWFSLLSYSPFTHLWVPLTTLLMQLFYFLFQVHMDEMDY